MSKLKKKPRQQIESEFRGLHLLKYKSAEEMEPVIRDYFEKEDRAKQDYTVAGLLLHLGFGSRKTLEDYRCREEFHELINRALLHIEDRLNKKLIKGQGIVAGQIFDLKVNHKWRDKDEQRPDTENQGKVIIVPVLPGALDMQQWSQFYQQMIDAQRPASQPPEIIDVEPAALPAEP